MIKGFLLFLITVQTAFAGETFIVTFKGVKATVNPQSKKGQFIGVTLKNDTFQRLRGEFRNKDGVLKHYSLRPGSSQSYEVAHKDGKQLSIVNLAPAFDTIPLKIGSKVYAIPK